MYNMVLMLWGLWNLIGWWVPKPGLPFIRPCYQQKVREACLRRQEDAYATLPSSRPRGLNLKIIDKHHVDVLFHAVE